MPFLLRGKASLSSQHHRSLAGAGLTETTKGPLTYYLRAVATVSSQMDLAAVRSNNKIGPDFPVCKTQTNLFVIFCFF